MPEFIITASATAPPHTVWEVLTDVERYAEVLTAVERIERLDTGASFGVWLRWRETRRPLSNEVTEVKQVTSVDNGAMTYVVEHESHGTRYRSTVSVTGNGAGSTVRVVSGLERPGLLAKLTAKATAKAFEFVTRPALQQDLDEIIAAAEARPT